MDKQTQGTIDYSSRQGILFPRGMQPKNGKKTMVVPLCHMHKNVALQYKGGSRIVRSMLYNE